MNNVVRLFDRENVEPVFSERARIAAAANRVLVANAKLDHAVEELSKRIATLQNAIASIDDEKTRSLLKQAVELSRAALFGATRQLNRQVGMLIERQGG